MRRHGGVGAHGNGAVPALLAAGLVEQVPCCVRHHAVHGNTHEHPGMQHYKDPTTLDLGECSVLEDALEQFASGNLPAWKGAIHCDGEGEDCCTSVTTIPTEVAYSRGTNAQCWGA